MPAASPRPAAIRPTPQINAAPLTPISSQSQSTPECTTQPTKAANANGTSGERRARTAPANGGTRTTTSSTRPMIPSSASVSAYTLCASVDAKNPRQLSTHSCQ